MDEQYTVILGSNLSETHLKPIVGKKNPFSEHSHFVSLCFGSYFIFLFIPHFVPLFYYFHFYPLKKKEKKKLQDLMQCKKEISIFYLASLNSALSISAFFSLLIRDDYRTS